MYYLRIPKERIGVLIGKNGEIKQNLEEITGISLEIDSELGDVTINDTHAKEPVMGLKVRDIVKAIGRGFSPEHAFRLLDEDIYFESIDIRDYVGRNIKHVMRMRARVIGTRGKTRKIIEMLTGVDISIYGNTVSMIGNVVEIGIAKTAIDMLLSGSEHSTVYKFLERKRRELKIAEMGF